VWVVVWVGGGGGVGGVIDFGDSVYR